jgi:hypothetical protein
VRRKIVLVVMLGLATALSLGAAPALAADGCNCHTAVPPTATAAHEPYVVSVTNCAVCHVGWTVPHPDVNAGLRLNLAGRSTETGYRLGGRLGLSAPMGAMILLNHPGVLVYLQQRLWGATAFTDLTQVTIGGDGKYGFTVASAPTFATYRAIAQGHVGPLFPLVGGGTGLFMPKKTKLLPTPELTIVIRGFDVAPITPASVKLGRTLRVEGNVAPADLGGKVIIRVQKRVAGRWVTRVSLKRAISATGTYGRKFTPKSHGAYRVDARIPATATHRGVVTRWTKGPWPTFRVY